MRFWTAFWHALRLTLRGQTPPALQHPHLLEWVRQLAALMDAVYAAADEAQLDRARRQTLTLRLDGRVMTVETVLSTVRFHARDEYPSLLRSGLASNLLGIHASNINDRYWISRLQALPEMQATPVAAALQRLADHLEALPTAKT
ncbi:MAG: hypothetical protein HZC41_09220 [Chloroflexi bacterium]|nr:hypothetical protein [Chloroflexota bacterium]